MSTFNSERILFFNVIFPLLIVIFRAVSFDSGRRRGGMLDRVFAFRGTGGTGKSCRPRRKEGVLFRERIGGLCRQRRRVGALENGR